MMISKLLNYFLLILCVFSLSSCNTGVYEKFREVPEKQWSKDYPMDYLVKIEKPRKYKFTVAFSYLAFIAQKEIKFHFKITSPSKKESFLSTYTVLLRDKDGKQLGDVMGNYGDIEQVLEDDFELKEKGEYKFELIQAAEAQSIGGVTRIGFKVNKSKK